MRHPDNQLALSARANAAQSPVENSNQSEFLLACLRAASLRVKLIATELDSVGVALRHNFVSHDGAIEWLRDLDLLDHVLPSSIGACEAAP
jgi:hypothetical protein